MESFSKDTLFNDLPQSIKQKIINIRNLSIQNKSVNLVPMKEFGHVSVPSSKNLQHNVIRMAKAFDKLETIDASENLRIELAEFVEFVNTYKMEIGNTNFVSEFEKTIGLMEDKFNKISKDLNLY